MYILIFFVKKRPQNTQNFRISYISVDFILPALGRWKADVGYAKESTRMIVPLLSNAENQATLAIAILYKSIRHVTLREQYLTTYALGSVVAHVFVLVQL